MEDGIVFERLYMAEVQCFWDAKPEAEIRHEDVMVSLLLQEMKTAEELVPLLRARKLKVVEFEDGNEIKDLQFTV